ncbi:DUF1549 domain-containing protein [Botrimarina hoheduenensis]|uniref:DUF1549 domain-containing protein n=1 Tax=Botrimarina hoheduenensis TaxID=2528000 RepID=A0A5C5VXP7_9BACT|nr:DUF1549 domain-containing protein [Botrimarina hoheduenensis]TWT42775.1 hypothetical protein Pla111_27490 [Botrimarina hoheduenensis]
MTNSPQSARLRVVAIAFGSLTLLLASATSATEGVDSSALSVARQVDQVLQQLPENRAAQFAPLVNEAAFLRRASLDVVGVAPPTADAQQACAAGDAAVTPQRRRAIATQLLEDPRFGDNMARYWRDAILARRLEERARVVAEPLVKDLAKWINQNDGWDEIARRFITAEGSTDEDGATAIIMAQDGRSEEIAAEVSRVFLGIQIQCAQCHDHPWDEWKREEFHELAAFFPRIGLRQRRDTRPPVFDVVVNDRADRPRFRKADNANRRGRPEHYMADLEHPEEPGKRMTPRFFLTGLEVSVGTEDAERRAALATAVIENPWFTQAIVNRVWSELIGYGFYPTVDDLGAEREVVAKPALDALVAGFEANGSRLKWLYETILLTDAYARQSRPRDEATAGVMTATVAQPLRSDVLFDTLVQVVGVAREEDRRAKRARAQQGPRERLAEVFGFDPSDPREDVVGTIPQSLLLMNSPAVHRLAKARPGTPLAELIAQHCPPDGEANHQAAIQELYFTVLTRKPTAEESQRLVAYLESSARWQPAYEDILWALLNTAEFSHRR